MTNPILSSTTDQFLTTKEAAQRLGVTLRTVQLWVNDGKLQAACTPGGHRRIRTSDVRALQESMGIKPAKAAVLLTDQQVLDALGGDKNFVGFARAFEQLVLRANGLGVDHA